MLNKPLLPERHGQLKYETRIGQQQSSGMHNRLVLPAALRLSLLLRAPRPSRRTDRPLRLNRRAPPRQVYRAAHGSRKRLEFDQRRRLHRLRRHAADLFRVEKEPHFGSAVLRLSHRLHCRQNAVSLLHIWIWLRFHRGCAGG